MATKVPVRTDREQLAPAAKLPVPAQVVNTKVGPEKPQKRL